MADIYVSTLSVPKIPRNKRIYSDGYNIQRTSIGTPQGIVDTRNHYESRILSYDAGDFATRDVVVDFQQSFVDTPYGYVKIYRYDSRPISGVFKTDVVYYYPDTDWKTIDGFEIIIEDYEDLTGVIIEYYFTEQN